MDGSANEALVEFLAKTFRRPRRDVAIIAGQKSRDKRASIDGLTEAEFTTRLSDILNGRAAG